MALGGQVNKIVNYTFRLNGANQMRAGLGGAATAAAGLATVAVGAGAALFALTDRITRAPAALYEMSTRVGIAAEDLATLGYIAEQDGASLESLEAGLKKMSRTIVDAADGTGEAVDALGRLGLTFDQLQGRSPEEQIGVLADAFSRLEDDTVRMAAAQEIFGRGGLALIPVLDRESAGIREMAQEARELGIVLDNDAYEAADRFQDSLTEMRAKLQGALFESIIPLIPQIEEIATQMMDLAKEALPALISLVQSAIPIINALAGGFTLAAKAASAFIASITGESANVQFLRDSLQQTADTLSDAVTTGFMSADEASAIFMDTLREMERNAGLTDEEWHALADTGIVLRDTINGLSISASAYIGQLVGVAKSNYEAALSQVALQRAFAVGMGWTEIAGQLQTVQDQLVEMRRAAAEAEKAITGSAGSAGGGDQGGGGSSPLAPMIKDAKDIALSFEGIKATWEDIGKDAITGDVLRTQEEKGQLIADALQMQADRSREISDLLTNGARDFVRTMLDGGDDWGENMLKIIAQMALKFGAMQIGGPIGGFLGSFL